MKKLFLLTIATLGLGVAFVNADERQVTAPRDQQGNPAFSDDYAGVEIATVTYSSANVLLFGNGGGTVHFVHLATGTATDFFIIRSTLPTNNATGAATQKYLSHVSGVDGISGGNVATGDYNTTNEMYRVYFASTSLNANGGFDYTFPVPIVINGGGTFKYSSVNGGPAVIGYNKNGN